MKKLMMAMLAAVSVFGFGMIAEAETVTTPEEFTAAVNGEGDEEIEVTKDMTITDVYVKLNRDMTISSDLIFRPAPDDGFFVKSFEIPAGVTLTIKGKVTTEHTFEDGFVIAQLYLNGGTLDISEGSVSDDCNICFNAGELIAPEGGFGENTAIERYLYENVDEQLIRDALEVESLRSVTVQAACTIENELVVPDGKVLNLSTVIKVADGAGIDGDVSVDENSGVILSGSGRVNDITVPDDMEQCIVIWAEDGSYSIGPYSDEEVTVTIGEWVEHECTYGNCTLVVTVKEILNPMLAIVEDETGEVNMYGVQIDGTFSDFDSANIEAGDVLTIHNPNYSVYDGHVEMSDAELVSCEKAAS